MALKKVTIYGERCSGTNYLEELLLANFDVEIVWTYGWKHFFGFNDLTNSDDTLFIGIVRNLEDWLNSLFREKHHLKPELTENVDVFLNSQFCSFYDLSENEIMQDRNMHTKERYTNIYEMRLVKTKFLIEDMPMSVKHYCLITHESLVNDFLNTMNMLKECNLKIKSDIEFPVNIFHYKKNNNATFVKKENTIPSDKIIINDELKAYEQMLFPSGPNSGIPEICEKIRDSGKIQNSQDAYF